MAYKFNIFTGKFDIVNDDTNTGVWGSITGTLSAQSDLQSALDLKANLASPTFTGTVTLPSTTSIGIASATEISYLDGLTSNIQAQLNAKAAALSGTINEIAYFNTATTISSLTVATYPSLTELSYVKGVSSALQTQINAKAPSTSPTFATSITGSYLTASEILITDGSKNIVSAAVATYPSLTELTYVKGVTSALQTQLNAKAASSHTHVEADISNLGTAVALVADKLSVFAATTSAELATVISDETGSGLLVFATNPSITNPTFVADSGALATTLLNGTCEGRLTLTTALPVTVADVTAAGTIYFTPYKGDRIAIYSGSVWKLYSFSELSLALTATANYLYDVFVYDNSGTLTLETAEWDNSTVTITIASPGVVTWTAHPLSNGNAVILSTSGALPTGLTAGTTYYVVNKATDTFQLAATIGGTAINTSGSQSGTHTAHSLNTHTNNLTTQNGVYVKSGDTTRRYLGSFRASGSNTTEDSDEKRFIWNYYNRIARSLITTGSASHSYTTGTWRSWNNDATLRVELVIGVREDSIQAGQWAALKGTGGAYVGIGINQTTGADWQTANNFNSAQIRSGGQPILALSAGYSYLQQVEFGGASTEFGNAYLHLLIPG